VGRLSQVQDEEEELQSGSLELWGESVYVQLGSHTLRFWRGRAQTWPVQVERSWGAWLWRWESAGPQH
jgi:hypothetical protein